MNHEKVHWTSDTVVRGWTCKTSTPMPKSGRESKWCESGKEFEYLGMMHFSLYILGALRTAREGRDAICGQPFDWSGRWVTNQRVKLSTLGKNEGMSVSRVCLLLSCLWAFRLGPCGWRKTELFKLGTAFQIMWTCDICCTCHVDDFELTKSDELHKTIMLTSTHIIHEGNSLVIWLTVFWES